MRRVQGGGLPRRPARPGPRNQLNLGHTFAHALEAAAGYDLPHGQAVALGLVAALRLSGNDEHSPTSEASSPRSPVEVDRDIAWAALARDKKTAAATRGSCCSSARRAAWGNEVPAADVRAALDSLIAAKG